MLTNGVHLSFNQMKDLLQLPMKVHINESSMENILSFLEVANITGVHIKKTEKSFILKHLQRVFYTPTLSTPP